ncbi:MAG TPA: SGNH/GDSL hydrolase family protein [Polyangia bacterium]|jgi:lysophospholipase L1-like esterase
MLQVERVAGSATPARGLAAAAALGFTVAVLAGGCVLRGFEDGTTATTVAGVPPCLSAPSDAVFIGDSYITGFLSPPLQPALGALYPTANAFRNYAVPGTAMATGGIGPIPPQFDIAVAVNPRVKLAILEGGGNDILLCDQVRFPDCDSLCSAPGSTAQTECTDIVNDAVAGAGQLMARMAAAGVADVVYFFYPHIPASGGGYQEILDYARPRMQQQCENAAAANGGRLSCHFIDLVPPFEAAGGDMNPANFSPLDGVHPSAAGDAIIAGQIWGTMQSSCLGQPADSGCCAP